MIRHYLRQSLRVLKKQRLFAAINVVGLSTAFAVAMLIILFVQDEFTFDRWQANRDEIVAVHDINLNDDGSVRSTSAYLPFPFAETLENTVPAVRTTVRMLDNSVVIRANGHSSQQTVLFVDSTFFDVFSNPILRGNRHNALSDPAAIVLTEHAARRHFGTTDVIGKSVEIRFEDSFESAEVSAVVADPPSNTNLPFEYLLPFHRTPLVYRWVADRTDRWNASSFNVFALMHESADLEQAEPRLAELWTAHHRDEAKGTYRFVKLRDLHLGNDRSGARTGAATRAATQTTGVVAAKSDPAYSLILIGIGLVILVLASINFVILSIGRSTTRAAEIGLRKAVGALRQQIIVQFGAESVIIAIVSLVFGLGLAKLAIPVFNALSGKAISFTVASHLPAVGVLLVVAIVTGVLAGWYPALTISRYRPIDTLRGKVRMGSTGTLTKVLVISQFAASVALAGVALSMSRQLDGMQRRNLGYDANNVIVVSANRLDGRALVDRFRQTIGTRADVSGVAGISFSINRGYSSEGWRDGEINRSAYVYNVEPEAVDLLGFEFAAGQNVRNRAASDSVYEAIINESLARELGLSPTDAVGREVAGYDQPAPIIAGVIRDANFQSLHVTIEPMMLTTEPGQRIRYALIRTTTGNYAPVLQAINEEWNAFAPDIPLSYSFLDDDVAKAYANEVRWRRIVTNTGIVAIVIACMGLFGLAALTTTRRTKEIGIRKVLGASISEIVALITRDLVWLLGLATAIGAPIAYLVVSKWSEGFAYREAFPLDALAASVVAVFVVAFTTVAYHAVRASMQNPVESLRCE